MNKKKNKCKAVYMIKHLSTGKTYIGSSKNYWGRVWGHRSTLRNNTHANKALQTHWNEYGENTFVFGIIEELTNECDITSKEQFWMNFYNAGNQDKCFNVNTKAYSSIGYKFSQESKDKMSVAKRGKKWTDAQRKALSGRPRSKRPHLIGSKNKLSKAITQLDLKGNIIQEWESINQCSIRLRLHKSNIIMCLKSRIKQAKGFKFEYK